MTTYTPANMGSENGEALTIEGWWWRRLLPLVLWITIILWVASRPKAAFFASDTMTFLGIPRDLLQYPYHFGVFFILVILFRRCSSAGNKASAVWKTTALSLLGCALVSLCSEWLQFYVPSRTPAIRDLFVDQSGALLGIVVMRHFSVKGVRWTSDV